MKLQHKEDDPIYFTHYDAEAFQKLIDTQKKLLKMSESKQA
jgi:hypothetical protein